MRLWGESAQRVLCGAVVMGRGLRSAERGDER